MFDRLSRFALLLWIAVLASRSAAQDLIVGPVGSGAPWTDLPLAVQAAQPGQRVLLWPGRYRAALFLDDSIEVIGAGSGHTIIESVIDSATGAALPAIKIHGLGSAERVRLSGLRLEVPCGASQSAPFILGADASLGRIEWHDLEIFPPPDFIPAANEPSGLVAISACTQVAIDAMRIYGRPDPVVALAPAFPTPREGAAGLLVQASEVWIHDLESTGLSTPDPFLAGFGGPGGSGLRAIASNLTLTKVSLRGAMSGGFVRTVADFGGAGLSLQQSFASLGGGPPPAARGASLYPNLLTGSVGLPGSALRLREGSAVLSAMDAALEPGAGGGTVPSASAVELDSSSTFQTLPHRFPANGITASASATHIAIHAQLSGEPLSEMVTAVDVAVRAIRRFPGTVGALFVQIEPMTPLWITPLDALGTGQIQACLAQDPSLRGQTLVVQSAQIIGPLIWFCPPSTITL